MYKCPHCHEELSNLDYSIPQVEYGSLSLPIRRYQGDDISNHGDYDSHDTESTESPRFDCPECHITIPLQDLIWEDAPIGTNSGLPRVDNNRQGEESVETFRPEFMGSGKTNQLNVAMICMSTRCGKSFIYDELDRFHECPHCGFNNDRDEFRKRIKSGAYNKDKTCLKN